MPPLIVEFGRGRYTQANCPPSDKVITSQKHEFLFIDTGPTDIPDVSGEGNKLNLRELVF